MDGTDRIVKVLLRLCLAVVTVTELDLEKGRVKDTHLLLD